MNTQSILSLIGAAATVFAEAQQLYAAAKSTLSETDQSKIDTALKAIQSKADTDFTRVDAELTQAAS